MINVRCGLLSNDSVNAEWLGAAHLLIAIRDTLEEIRSLRLGIRKECDALVVDGCHLFRHGGKRVALR